MACVFHRHGLSCAEVIDVSYAFGDLMASKVIYQIVTLGGKVQKETMFEAEGIKQKGVKMWVEERHTIF